MDFSVVNWLAVVVAAVAAWLFGAAWYMALSKPWMAAAKIDPSKSNRSIAPFIVSFVAEIVMAFVLQVSSAILTEASLSLLGLGPSNGVSLGIMLHWALASEAVRTGAWWAFVPPTVLLTLIAFSLMMLQSSLDELFNPRLRRGALKLRRLVRAPVPAAQLAGAASAEPVTAAGAAVPPQATPASPAPTTTEQTR